MAVITPSGAIEKIRQSTQLVEKLMNCWAKRSPNLQHALEAEHRKARAPRGVEGCKGISQREQTAVDIVSEVEWIKDDSAALTVRDQRLDCC
jgi:hypothetical protein